MPTKAYYAANREKMQAQARARYYANPKRSRGYSKKYQRTHRAEIRIAERAWRAKHPTRRDETNFRSQLKSEYGMTLEEYRHLLDEQGGVCAICRRQEHVRGRGGKPRRLGVDHNHTTGRVRGLLCHACNVSIGLLSIEQLEAAVSYLRSH